MLWIREVEIAKSSDDLKTLRSILGKDFRDFDMLDAMITSIEETSRQAHSLPQKSKCAHDLRVFPCYWSL